jgi:peptidoglycan hydrolase-like protein with peptidoglycan-binding domain
MKPKSALPMLNVAIAVCLTFLIGFGAIAFTQGQPTTAPATTTTATAAKKIVQGAQERLQALGYQPGSADGVMGTKAVAALKKFQSDHSLPVTGQLDRKTLDALHVGNLSGTILAPTTSPTMPASSGSPQSVKATPPDPETILSADLKQTLLAAADPTSTDADVRSYIRTARMQVRTQKDHTVFDKLVKYVALLDDASKQDESRNQLSFDFKACVEYMYKDFRAPDFDESLLTGSLLDDLKQMKSNDDSTSKRMYLEEVARDQYNNYTSYKNFRHADCKVEKALNDQTEIEARKISVAKNQDLESAKLLYNEFRTDLGLTSDAK